MLTASSYTGILLSAGSSLEAAGAVSRALDRLRQRGAIYGAALLLKKGGCAQKR